MHESCGECVGVGEHAFACAWVRACTHTSKQALEAGQRRTGPTHTCTLTGRACNIKDTCEKATARVTPSSFIFCRASSVKGEAYLPPTTVHPHSARQVRSEQLAGMDAAAGAWHLQARARIHLHADSGSHPCAPHPPRTSHTRETILLWNAPKSDV